MFNSDLRPVDRSIQGDKVFYFCGHTFESYTCGKNSNYCPSCITLSQSRKPYQSKKLKCPNGHDMSLFHNKTFYVCDGRFNGILCSSYGLKIEARWTCLECNKGVVPQPSDYNFCGKCYSKKLNEIDSPLESNEMKLPSEQSDMLPVPAPANITPSSFPQNNPETSILNSVEIINSEELLDETSVEEIPVLSLNSSISTELIREESNVVHLLNLEDRGVIIQSLIQERNDKFIFEIETATKIHSHIQNQIKMTSTEINQLRLDAEDVQKKVLEANSLLSTYDQEIEQINLSTSQAISKADMIKNDFHRYYQLFQNDKFAASMQKLHDIERNPYQDVNEPKMQEYATIWREITSRKQMVFDIELNKSRLGMSKLVADEENFKKKLDEVVRTNSELLDKEIKISQKIESLRNNYINFNQEAVQNEIQDAINWSQREMLGLIEPTGWNEIGEILELYRSSKKLENIEEQMNCERK